jgi:tetratricopeptide (TPR) repeat protein
MNRLELALNHVTAGKLDAAEDLCRLNLAENPDDADTLRLLGIVAHRSKRDQEAVDWHRRALAIRPDDAFIQYDLGNALASLGRDSEALAAFLEAIRVKPDHYQALAQAGMILQRLGKLNEAVPYLQKAAEFHFSNPEGWRRLAELHAEREDFDESAAAWSRAVELNPTNAAWRVAWADALNQIGKYQQAEDEYREGMRLDPNFALAYVNLGRLYTEQGELAKGEDSFRTAIRIQPDYALAYGGLAFLLRKKTPEEDIAHLEHFLNDSSLDDYTRHYLLFGLGHALDGRGDYARAAECATEANRLKYNLGMQTHHVYDPVDHENCVSWMIQTFTPAFFQRLRGTGSPSRRPVFVFGMPRSGSTLVEQVLSSHSKIHGGGEMNLVLKLCATLPKETGCEQAPLECIARLNPAIVERLANRHLDALAEIDGGAYDRICDKLLQNYMYLGLMALLFPNATYIHCRRDLRDIAVSCWMTGFRGLRWTNNMDHLAHRFQQYRRMAEHWRNVLPVPIHEVHYEDMVGDLEGSSRRLIAAAGLDWEDGCLAFYRNKRVVKTASLSQVRQPIYNRSSGRWKNYEQPLAALFSKLPPEF